MCAPHIYFLNAIALIVPYLKTILGNTQAMLNKHLVCMHHWPWKLSAIVARFSIFPFIVKLCKGIGMTNYECLKDI